MGVSLALPHHHLFFFTTSSSIIKPSSSPSQFPPPPRPLKPLHINLKTAIPRHVRRTIAKAIEEEEEGQDQQSENTESGRDETLETLGGGGGGGGGGVSVSQNGNGWWGGVAEEIGEIEWPAFGRVVGTTGVVLAVIAGSSVVLLTVNAVLAELSDRLFNGRGLQDFFA